MSVQPMIDTSGYVRVQFVNGSENAWVFPANIKALLTSGRVQVPIRFVNDVCTKEIGSIRRSAENYPGGLLGVIIAPGYEVKDPAATLDQKFLGSLDIILLQKPTNLAVRTKVPPQPRWMNEMAYRARMFSVYGGR